MRNWNLSLCAQLIWGLKNVSGDNLILYTAEQTFGKLTEDEIRSLTNPSRVELNLGRNAEIWQNRGNIENLKSLKNQTILVQEGCSKEMKHQWQYFLLPAKLRKGGEG